jgi:hypothetical protein
MGTAVGTRVFFQNGWRAAAALSMALFGLQIVVLLVRGPHARRHTWFGYEGGLEARKSIVLEREEERVATADVDEKEKVGLADIQFGSRPVSLNGALEPEADGHELEERDQSDFV